MITFSVYSIENRREYNGTDGNENDKDDKN